MNNSLNLPHARCLSVHDDIENLSAAVARRVAELSREAIATRGVFRIALAGGETPRRCYEKLRGLAIDWAHVEVYFGDERSRPAGDPQRNDTMAYDALLKHVAIPPANIHSVPVLGTEQAADSYAALLQQAGPLDLALLGMGEDGHTASLFPGNPAAESSAPAVAVFDSPKPPPERVSLGMEALNAARHKIFLVAGSGKRDALLRIMQGARLPAGRVMDAEWYLDRAALPPN